MKQIDPQDQASVLAQWRGATAILWGYHVSHSRTVVNLSKKGEHNAIYIVGIGSERISGPLRWEGANIAVVFEPSNEGEFRCRILDMQAGFELQCSDVVIFVGADKLPHDPLDGFIGGK